MNVRPGEQGPEEGAGPPGSAGPPPLPRPWVSGTKRRAGPTLQSLEDRGRCRGHRPLLRRLPAAALRPLPCCDTNLPDAASVVTPNTVETSRSGGSDTYGTVIRVPVRGRLLDGAADLVAVAAANLDRLPKPALAGTERRPGKAPLPAIAPALPTADTGRAMSQENVDTFRAGVCDLPRRDVEAVPDTGPHGGGVAPRCCRAARGGIRRCIGTRRRPPVDARARRVVSDLHSELRVRDLGERVAGDRSSLGGGASRMRVVTRWRSVGWPTSRTARDSDSRIPRP